MAGVLQKLGFALRETGQALDRLGCLLQGNYAFREQRESKLISSCPANLRNNASFFTTSVRVTVNRSRSLINVFDKQPSVGRNAFVAPSAVLSGDVSLGSEASVFYGAVLRGESFARCSSNKIYACFVYHNFRKF
jgi:gamma-carbonic anhydrase